MSRSVPASLDRRVRLRAGNRCEYCRLSQERQEATFHVDHVVPQAAGGRTILENLALACVSCSLRKGARTESVDTETGASAGLFNPRQDVWAEHFRIDEAVVVGLTPMGRVSAKLLQMNRPLAVAIRRFESDSLP